MHAVPSAVETIHAVHSRHWRFRLTNQCNARCYFCHGEGFSLSGMTAYLDPCLLQNILNTFVSEGDTIALTGGEPLLHPELPTIIDIVSKIHPNFHLNTNGILLHEKIGLLTRSDLKFMHVNMTTLSPQIYRKIYGVCRPVTLLESLREAQENGIEITLNCVIQSGINSSFQELKDFIEFCSHSNFMLTIIEPHCVNSFSDGRVFQRRYEKYLLKLGYIQQESQPGRVIYGKGRVMVKVAAPCAPAKAWNGDPRNDAYVVLEDGTIRRFYD